MQSGKLNRKGRSDVLSARAQGGAQGTLGRGCWWPGDGGEDGSAASAASSAWHLSCSHLK